MEFLYCAFYNTITCIILTSAYTRCINSTAGYPGRERTVSGPAGRHDIRSCNVTITPLAELSHHDLTFDRLLPYVRLTHVATKSS